MGITLRQSACHTLMVDDHYQSKVFASVSVMIYSQLGRYRPIFKNYELHSENILKSQNAIFC